MQGRLLAKKELVVSARFCLNETKLHGEFDSIGGQAPELRHQSEFGRQFPMLQTKKAHSLLQMTSSASGYKTSFDRRSVVQWRHCSDGQLTNQCMQNLTPVSRTTADVLTSVEREVVQVNTLPLSR